MRAEKNVSKRQCRDTTKAFGAGEPQGVQCRCAYTVKLG